MPVSLVTGGAGFIGSHLANKLKLSGHTVYVLDDLSGGFRENVPTGVTFVHGSICDASLVDALFKRVKFDYVYHLAAYAAEGLSHFIRRYNYNNNVVGSINLINACLNHDVQRFVFTSSIAVYGDQKPPFTEAMDCRPIDPYGVAKYAVELDLAAAARTHGLQYTVFRPHNVFGERQNIADRYRNVIGIFMNQCRRREPLTIFGNGEQTRAFTHVDNIIPYIAHCVDYSSTVGKTFNVGGTEVLSVKNLADKVMQAMGYFGGITYLPERHEAVDAYSDHSALRAAMPNEDLISPLSIDTGIARMASWVHMLGSKDPSTYWDIEVPRNLPEAWRIT